MIEKVISDSLLVIVCTIGFLTIFSRIMLWIEEYLHIRDFKRRLKNPWKPE